MCVVHDCSLMNRGLRTSTVLVTSLLGVHCFTAVSESNNDNCKFFHASVTKKEIDRSDPSSTLGTASTAFQRLKPIHRTCFIFSATPATCITT
jgi:hypothetical protein